MRNIFICILLLCVLRKVYGEENPYKEALKARPWRSIQRYAEVRPGAHMFYWLYYADGVAQGAERKPLIIWIQGGPGLAASGLANFAELGPLTMDFKPRNHTWVNGRNVLLLDHPVGTGFSYVNNSSLLVKTDRELATDLAKAIKMFFRRFKKFRKTPTYLFGQSYGGKTLPRLTYYLHKAIKNKSLKMNLKGIGIGSGWVDPKESSLIQPEYLYNMGILDRQTYLEAKEMARKLSGMIETKQYELANSLDDALFRLLLQGAGVTINFNKINQESQYPALDKLAVKVNTYVKPMMAHVVNQSLKWNYFSDEVYQNLNPSLLIPSNKFLEALLNETELTVAVYNGNLDAVTPLAGASNWVHKLRWAGASDFHKALRRPIRGDKNGFYKITGQLSFWTVFGSGHWIPEDNPVAMQQILDYVIDDHLD